MASPDDDMFGTGPDFWNPRPRFWAGVPLATPTVPTQTQTPAQTPTSQPGTLGGLGAGQPVTPTAPQSEAERLRQQGPPQLTGWKKGLDIGANIASRVLGVGNLERSVASSIPGSPENYQARLGQAQAQEKQDIGRQKSQADLRNVQSEIDLRSAEADKARREAPQKPESLDQVEADLYSQRVAAGEDPTRVLRDIYTARGAAKPEPRESKAVAGTIDGNPAWGVQTDKGWIDPQTQQPIPKFSPEKPEKAQPPQRMLGVTPDGKVIELQPGMTLAPGTKPLAGELNMEVKQGQAEQAGLAAQQYAKDYLASKNFTGPGDEGLMEKFFELAKPSSGFRMTTAQQQMLLNAQSWRNSIEAFARHALTGVWFSDQQRKQIVDTMSALQKSREEVKPGAGGAGAAPPTAKSQWQNDGAGNYRYSNDGGKTWNNYGGPR